MIPKTVNVRILVMIMRFNNSAVHCKEIACCTIFAQYENVILHMGKALIQVTSNKRKTPIMVLLLYPKVWGTLQLSSVA